MLTMFPLPMIEEYANINGWTIHRIERTISASKQVDANKKNGWYVIIQQQETWLRYFSSICGMIRYYLNIV